MTNTHDGDIHDAVFLLSAQSAGGHDIDEYLSLEEMKVSRKCRFRIMKRIRHSDIYKNGKLCTKAKVTAVILLVLLAAVFAAAGYCGARLTYDITNAKDKKQLFAFDREESTSEKHPEITEFYKPSVPGMREEILVKSSLMYNVRYTSVDGTLYYCQTPKIQPSENGEDAENARKDDTAQMYVLVGDHTGEVYITDDGREKTFELCWSDDNYSYTIYPAKSVEQAAMLAQSIYKKGN